MIITIDGPAGSGKSTAAKNLAKELGFIHFNSGALYRGITAHLYSNSINIESLTIDTPISNVDLSVKMIDGVQHVFVNNIDYTNMLRDNVISTLVAYVGANRNCRELIDNCQKDFCSKNNVVMEGRDLGSFVFPNAEMKFYLDCSIKERAKRRFNEEQAKNNNVSLEEIEQQIAERDYLDKSREIAPLVCPKDAIIIDSSNLTIDEVVLEMKSHINKETFIY